MRHMRNRFFVQVLPCWRNHSNQLTWLTDLSKRRKNSTLANCRAKEGLRTAVLCCIHKSKQKGDFVTFQWVLATNFVMHKRKNIDQFKNKCETTFKWRFQNAFSVCTKQEGNFLLLCFAFWSCFETSTQRLFDFLNFVNRWLLKTRTMLNGPGFKYLTKQTKAFQKRKKLLRNC